MWAHSACVVSGIYTAPQQNPSTVTVADFHLELDFCLTKQLQELIHVGVSISPRFNESGPQRECKCPTWKRLTALLHTFSYVWHCGRPHQSLCLKCKQQLKTSGKYFQFKGSFEDVTLNQQRQTTVCCPVTHNKRRMRVLDHLFSLNF